MNPEFTVFTLINASPQQAYDAWLDSDSHSQMTGSPAKVSAELDAAFEAWDGYISGKNMELDPGKRILQSWRTVEFSESEKDSMIEVSFESAEGGTKITLRHWDLPEHGAQYESGWEESYFSPMRAHFNQ